MGGGLDVQDGGIDSPRNVADTATSRLQGSVASAALCLGALLFTMSSISSFERLPARNSGLCAFPHEIASQSGWTTDVGCEVSPASSGKRLRGPARLLFGLTLDLNRADQRSLEVLPQIGPRRAAAIVDARAEAAFASVAELARIRGIGAKTIAGLEGWVGVGRGE